MLTMRGSNKFPDSAATVYWSPLVFSSRQLQSVNQGKVAASMQCVCSSKVAATGGVREGYGGLGGFGVL